MLYSRLAELYEKLESTSSRLDKTKLIAELLKESDSECIPIIALLVQGKIFPDWSDKEVGVALKLMTKTVAKATGFPESEITSMFNKSGDLGTVAEELVSKKRQKSLFSAKLTLQKVSDNMQKIADMEGSRSQDRKQNLIAELMISASPKEAKYIVRIGLQDLRIGVAEGVVRDAIVQAFLNNDGKESKELKEETAAVEWAWYLRSDYGEVAKIAKESGLSGLKKVKLEVGKPYHVLLCERSPGMKEALETFENPALEFKYDGARVLIHKKGNEISFFTRRLENITKQFPELKEYVLNGIAAKECVIEGEILGFDKKTGKPMPFQFLSQRIRRKYDIQRLVEEIPIQVDLFDIVYLEGKELFSEPLSKRWELLNSIVKPIEGKFRLADHMETKDLDKANEFYQKALAASQEGLIIKNMDAGYQPGRRVGYWLKVKPTLETLDLAIIGATWGTGKRAGWLGSFIIGCKDPHTGEFLECGMLGTGFKEKEGSDGITLDELTKMLKPHITEEKGNNVKIKPSVVVEVAYEELQRSPTYSSGWALRFPRVLRLRADKSIDEADSIDRIEKIASMQKGNR